MEEFFSSEYAPQVRDLFLAGGEFWEVLDRLEEYIVNIGDGRIESPIPEGVVLKRRETISIARNCVIEEGAMIVGPAIIEEGVTIRHGAYIRGSVIAASGSVIGHATEVKNSILFPHAKAPHFNYVADSVLGEGVNLGAGVVLANLRFDGKEISLFFRGKEYPTRRRKVGAFIADGAFLGCHCVTNPGALLAKNTFFRPNTTISHRLLWDER